LIDLFIDAVLETLTVSLQIESKVSVSCTVILVLHKNASCGCLLCIIERCRRYQANVNARPSG